MSSPRFPPTLVLAVGVLAVSFSAIFIRLAQTEEAVPSLAIAAWRTTIATLILLPMAWLRRRQELREMKMADWLLASLAGLMLGIHFGTWITSLAYTSIASSAVLVSTSPLWVGLAAPFVLHEPLTRWLKIGLGLALVGSLMIAVGDGLQLADSRRAMTGNGLALSGAIAMAVYYLIGRRLRQGLSLLSYSTVVYGIAAVTLVGYSLVSQVLLVGYSPAAYGLFVLMAVFPQLIGHSSFNWALAYLPVTFVAVTIISEPVGATLLGVLILGEVPSGVTIAGSLVVLAGIVVAGISKQ
jgi:drug/metabolite transporter (DMT)-like permease